MASMSDSGKRGLDITPNFRTAVNRSGQALVRGDVVMFDHTQGDGDTSNSDKARDNSAHVNVVLPATALLSYGVFAVALESIADDAEGQIALSGDHLPINVDTAASAGAALIPVNAADAATDTAGAAGQKIIGILGDALAAGGVGTCAFDGINGFGAAADQ